jgi:hypothetical protein
MHNTLIDIGVAINVMKRDNMFRLDLQELSRHTPTILQLANRSTVSPEGVLEDVMVPIDS